MKYFENAEIEVISFAAADVITTSGGYQVDENGGIDSELDWVTTLPSADE